MLAQVDAMGRKLAALGIPLHLLRVETFAEVPTALAASAGSRGQPALRQPGHRELTNRAGTAVSAALGSRA